MLKKLIKFLTVKSNTDIGILVIKSTLDNFGKSQHNKTELLQLKPNKIKFNINQKHQIADPFLIKYDKDIWLFFEEKGRKQKGVIKTLCLTNENQVESIVDFNLENNIHMSYPFVFWDKHQLFIIPETAEIGEIGLYLCSNFPNSWVKFRTIMKGNFVDSSIYEELGIYYLFTTEKVIKNGKYNYKLRLFYAQSLVDDFKEHPYSPIKIGRKYGRSGGAVIKVGHLRFRFSQDCSVSYGRELIQFQIKNLDPLEYQEELISNNWIHLNFNHKMGGHHCSVIAHDVNSMLIAVDLNYQENYFQRFINKILY